MTNFGPVNTLVVNTTRRSTTSSEYIDFLYDEKRESVFFLDFTYRDRVENAPLTTRPNVVNTIPVNVIRTMDQFTAPESRLFFSSKNWIGRPDDPIRPNTAPKRRLKAAFRIRRTTPYFPADESRIQVTIASATIENVDNEFDFLAFQKTGEGYRAPIWHGPLDGSFDKAQRLIQPKVATVETSGEDLTIQFQTESSQFSTLNLQRARYDGSGGINGDPGLKDTLKPLVFGSVFTMDPVLIYAAQLIYQVNSGPVSGIGPILEGGAPLTFYQDFPSFEALAEATVPPGQYATCLLFGCFKLGLSPIHKLTCSVRGDATGGVYRQDAGAILFHVLTTIAGRQTSLFDISSFSTLSKAEIGWYNERKEYTIEDFINIILKPENAVLGDRSTGRIGVIKHRPLADQAASKILTVRPAQLEVRNPSFVPYASQTVLYGKNWSPYAETDFDAGLPEEDRAPLRDQYRKAKASSGFISAFTGISSVNSTKESWFATAQGAAAQNQANDDVRMYGRSTIGLTIKGLKRSAFDIRDGEVISLVCPKFGFDNGRNVVVVGVDESAKGELVDLEVVA